jgi:hypothetical protein
MERIGELVETVIVVAMVAVLACVTWALAAELAVTGQLLFPKAGAAEMIVPVAPEPPVVELVLNAPDETMGSLPVAQQAQLVYFSGLALEIAANGTTAYGDGGFTKSFLKHFGVQLQIAALERSGLINNSNPTAAALQGFFIGL